MSRQSTVTAFLAAPMTGRVLRLAQTTGNTQFESRKVTVSSEVRFGTTK